MYHSLITTATMSAVCLTGISSALAGEGSRMARLGIYRQSRQNGVYVYGPPSTHSLATSTATASPTRSNSRIKRYSAPQLYFFEFDRPQPVYGRMTGLSMTSPKTVRRIWVGRSAAELDKVPAGATILKPGSLSIHSPHRLNP